MSKLLSISIDTTKLDKSRFYEGKNGAKYCSLDVWVDDEPDKYGRDASVSESLTRMSVTQAPRRTTLVQARSYTDGGTADHPHGSQPTSLLQWIQSKKKFLSEPPT